MLTGKKTYLSAALMGLATFARLSGWLDHEQYQILMGLMVPAGLAALRAGVKSGVRD